MGRLGFGLLCLALAAPAGALEKVQWASMESAAQQAAKDCLHLMHHDTDEFSACVDRLIEGGAGMPRVQLASAYLGLVGCLSAGRMATLHSDDCARAYLGRVDGIRAKLRLSDRGLCPLVKGDCTGRVAQIEALRRTAAQTAPSRRAETTSGR